MAGDIPALGSSGRWPEGRGLGRARPYRALLECTNHREGIEITALEEVSADSLLRGA